MTQGSCLCGQVRFEHTGPLQIINLCHCSRCRKATGSAFGSFLHAGAAGFRWTRGAEQVTNYMPHEGTHRAFCKDCGSSLPLLEEDDVIIPAGSLDTDPGIEPIVHIFTGSMAPWYRITDDLTRFEAFPSDEWIEAALEDARKRDQPAGS